MSDETPRKIAAHHCIDMEQHARSFNEGYEAAMTQHLADDPTAADDWLAEHDRQVRETLLTEIKLRLTALPLSADRIAQLAAVRASS